MRTLTLASIAFLATILLSGCGSKRYFEPESVAGKVKFEGRLPAPIISAHREGAMLENGQFITREGLQSFKLPKGYNFLSDSERYFVATSEAGALGLFPKNGGEMIAVETEFRALAARVEGELLALVLADNTILLHHIPTAKNLFSQKGESAVALNALIASPIFLKDLVLYPTLEGRLVVVDRTSHKAIRNIVVHGDSYFNNVIFLDVLDNRLVAATPKRVISVSPELINTYEANIRDLLFVRDRIYLLTNEGEVILTDQDLNVMRQKKFPFAHFSGAIHGKYIYAIEKQGYLVALDVDLLDSHVYESSEEVDRPLFVAGDKLYLGDRYFELNR